MPEKNSYQDKLTILQQVDMKQPERNSKCSLLLSLLASCPILQNAPQSCTDPNGKSIFLRTGPSCHHNLHCKFSPHINEHEKKSMVRLNMTYERLFSKIEHLLSILQVKVLLIMSLSSSSVILVRA